MVVGCGIDPRIPEHGANTVIKAYLSNGCHPVNAALRVFIPDSNAVFAHDNRDTLVNKVDS
jgi:hypothetical protein